MSESASPQVIGDPKEPHKCFQELFADATFIFMAYLILLYMNGRDAPSLTKVSFAIGAYVLLVALFQYIENMSVAKQINSAMGIALGTQIMGMLTSS